MHISRVLFYMAGIIGRICKCEISANYLPLPSLTVTPSQPSYNIGETITMMCSPPNNIDVEGIRYFKNRTEVHFHKNKETNPYYTKSKLRKEDEGSYMCDYSANGNGTEKLSYPSKEVNIMIKGTSPIREKSSWPSQSEGEETGKRTPPIRENVTYYLPLPSLTVTPSQPIYDIGQTITMMCSPPNNIDVEGIRYFKNNTEINYDKNKEINLYTKILTKEDEGFYRCDYWVKNNISYPSNGLNIVIRDTTPSWIYYIAGGVVFIGVVLSLYLLYKRTKKRKSQQSTSGTHLAYRNPGHGISDKPVESSDLSPMVQNHLSNPLYSVICHNTAASEPPGSTTWMMSDSENLVAEDCKTTSASEEEAHIYSEIVTGLHPNEDNQQPTIDSKDSPLHKAICTIYHTIQAAPTLSTDDKATD
ncbi:uncharacterized protein [Dendropsophus ebraccatus]|uniref:uncharacterized protein n=1 Tax=Dendropsophus ebraccatus TaxID=150705 RepID=UPI00383112C8